MTYPKYPTCQCGNALLVAMPAECPKCTEKAVRLQALLDAAGDVCDCCGGRADYTVKPAEEMPGAYELWPWGHRQQDGPHKFYCTASPIHARIKQEQR